MRAQSVACPQRRRQRRVNVARALAPLNITSKLDLHSHLHAAAAVRARARLDVRPHSLCFLYRLSSKNMRTQRRRQPWHFFFDRHLFDCARAREKPDARLVLHRNHDSRLCDRARQAREQETRARAPPPPPPPSPLLLLPSWRSSNWRAPPHNKRSQISDAAADVAASARVARNPCRRFFLLNRLHTKCREKICLRPLDSCKSLARVRRCKTHEEGEFPVYL